MVKFKTGIKKATSLLMSALLSLSVFSVVSTVDANAVSYSEMSALDQYAYSGEDLGAVYSKSSTTFKVWAPTASAVQIKRYKTGSDSESGAGVIETKDMTKQSQGIWSITISGDLANTYYTYLVTVNGKTNETVDIYARSTGVNGKRGMVVDLDGTDPDGWENDKRVECINQTDAVIWEAHVRDFSSSSDSGMTNKGKYLAFTETGTTVNGDGVHPTGVDYLEDLGITHVHLLPVYDYGSVDETKLDTDQFNWGYDPMNYNTPEGSYSTDPYHGEVRVKEFKQMVQSLHKKNIGVVMDVVYNHTYAGTTQENDWFDYTVPGYYYRQSETGGLSNASGCGNETASDRAMYQKYMIDSVVYWATEYHLDGFRFDLMGIHDVDTMNKIRAALDKIDPDILIYGEPWTADATTCPKSTAVQSNMCLVSEEIAAFNDKVRDAIKGSCFNAADCGFIQGAGYETALKGGIQANSTTMAGTGKWSKQPSQTVTYTSAHDNYTLYDKLVKSVKGGSGYGSRYDDLVAMNKMAGGIILTSQGMSFFQAGEEFARTKYGDENSYKSSTFVNQLKWQNTITYSDIASYYKGLIEIRKAYAPFRDPTNTSNDTIYFSWGTNCPANVVAFTMYNKLSSDGWNFAAVIHNANSSSKTVTLMTYDGVTLPSQWVIVADGTNAGTLSLGTTGSTVTVPARSTVVLIDKTSFDNTDISKKCTVTVNHIIKSTGKTYQTETLKGNEGASYTTSPLSSLLNNGYTLTSTTGVTSGTFSKEGTAVNYYYDIDTTKYGTVVVNYVDASSGSSIADSDTYTGLIGNSYSYSPKTVKGYECDTSLTSNASGKFVSGTTTVTFQYNPVETTGLTIHYYNTNSWSQVAMYVYSGSGTTAKLYAGAWPGTLMTSDGNNWYSGTIDDVESALFIANNNNNGSQDPTGVGTSGYTVSGEVWIKSGKVYPTGKVVVKYTDENGKTLATETLKGMADGTNSYTTSAKTFDGYILSTTPSNASGKYAEGTTTVTYVYQSDIPIPVYPLINNSTISATTITLGSSLTLKGAASDGVDPYTYAVYYKQTSQTTWTKVQDYASSITKSITPKAATTYTVRVKAKDSSGQIKNKDFKVTVKKESTELTNNSTISATSIALGSSLTLKGAATGGTSPYTYAVYYKQTSQTNWTKVQDYASSITKTVTPKAATTYTVRVKAKDSNGTIKNKDFTVKVTKALTNNSTISATSISLGSSVTLKGAATGGTGSYTYAVYYKKTSSSTWTMVQTYVSSITKSVTPLNATTYTVRVKAKDSSGTIANKDFTVKVTNTPTILTNNSTISATSISLGNSVALKGAATGGTSPYTYAVYYKRTSQTSWTKVQDYASSITKSVTPLAATTYTVRVKVKDSAGTIKDKDFTVTVATELIANADSSAYSVKNGTAIKVTGSASGGTGGYTYEISYMKSTASTWTTVKAYSTTASKTFTLPSTGTFNIRVNVKDSAGNVSSDYVTVKVTS